MEVGMRLRFSAGGWEEDQASRVRRHGQLEPLPWRGSRGGQPLPSPLPGWRASVCQPSTVSVFGRPSQLLTGLKSTSASASRTCSGRLARTLEAGAEHCGSSASTPERAWCTANQMPAQEAEAVSSGASKREAASPQARPYRRTLPAPSASISATWAAGGGSKGQAWGLAGGVNKS